MEAIRNRTDWTINNGMAFVERGTCIGGYRVKGRIVPTRVPTIRTRWHAWVTVEAASWGVAQSAHARVLGHNVRHRPGEERVRQYIVARYEHLRHRREFVEEEFGE